MWMNIVKALPRKEDIENYLLDDKGVDVIEGMAKLPDKKMQLIELKSYHKVKGSILIILLNNRLK